VAQPGRELNRLEIVQALRISNVEGVVATVHTALTTGAIQTGFALWLGASNLWMGLIAAIPTLSQLVQIPSALWVERRGERKRFTAYTAGISRFLWLPILLIPFTLPREIQFTSFVVLFLAASILASMPGPAYTSWMSDLVPANHRGRYFSQRNMLIGITTTVVALPAGWYLDWAKRGGGSSMGTGFAVLFAIGVICGFASFMLLMRQSEPPMTATPARDPGLLNTARYYLSPFGDKAFRSFMVFGGLFAVGQFFAAPFYMVYSIETLHLQYSTIQALAALQSLCTLLSLPAWGYLSDKYGHRPLLGLSVAIVGLTPFFWTLTRPDMPFFSGTMLILVHVSGGIGWAGVALTQLNLLIAETPSDRKAVYVAAMSAITGIAGGLAPIMGGVVISASKNVHLNVFGWIIGQYKVSFLISASFRYIALIMLRFVRGEESATAREVLTRLGTTNMSGWKAVRSLQPGQPEHIRREAARTLQDVRTSLAVDELISALSDPSLHVREEAARALGEIGDHRAADALILVLNDPASGAVDEAAEALGRMAVPEAVMPLSKVLQEGEKTDRIAAARALGRISGEQASLALMYALNDPEVISRPDLIEAIIFAIGRTAYGPAAPLLATYLDSESRSLRLAAVRSIGDIADPVVAPKLLGLLKVETDPAVIAHAAVALALMHAEDAVGTILESLDHVDSPVARKQMLHSGAALLGFGDELYSLISQDSFVADQAVDKHVRSYAGQSANVILERYMAEDYPSAAKELSRVMIGHPLEPSAATSAINWFASTANRRSMERSEVMFGLFLACNAGLFDSEPTTPQK
jgi:HEAT repeat protein/Na+/melibiose symporter-like transporter